ncbi:MAG: hypothetical protein LBH43_14910 [Treponema sp.]|nr:hypothetical protein [Treponema sp.]
MRLSCKRLLAGVFLVLAAAVFMTVILQKQRQSSLQYIQEHEISPFLKDGDIICRLGDRPWSRLFKNLSPDDKRFSHLGIVRIRNNNISIINAEGLAIEGKDYVNEVSLEQFTKIAQSIGIYRARTIEGAKISDAALEYMGRPFDWQFDMANDDKLYCTELLYAVMKKLEPEITLNVIWIKEIGRYVVPVDACSRSDFFVEVGYWGRNSSPALK